MVENVYQPSLFDLLEVETKTPEPKPTRWYYVTRRRNTEMLHYVSRDGTAVWIENDPREVQPMLFNSAATAKLSMRKHGGTEVKRYTQKVRGRKK
jgi:hypothetical protein